MVLMLDKLYLEIPYVMDDARLQVLTEIITNNGVDEREVKTLHLGRGAEIGVETIESEVIHIIYEGRSGIEISYYPITRMLIVPNISREHYAGICARTFDTIVDIVLRNYSK